jgi:subtilase family serine protease
MKRRRFFFSSFATTATRNFLVGPFLLVLGVSAIAQSQASATARVNGHMPKAVIDGTATLIGHYNPNQTLRLVIGLQPPHPEEEEQFLRDVQTKDSPEFHHFLTTEQWNARFAPSVQDEQAVVDWATSQGLRVTHRYPNRLLVDMEGPVSTIEKAFGVVMNSYQRGATIFFSSDREPTIPGSLSTIIHSVGGLNNWEVMQPNNK